MPRYRMTVRYEGTDFAGSQIQPGQRTVQGTLKAELDDILKQDCELVFASRTDTGVHAEGNVCAFDADLPMPPANLVKALNSRLPRDIDVRDAAKAEAEFNPRFAAVSRSYVYRIWNAEDLPLERKRFCARVEQTLDTDAMRLGLEGLRGRHSFASFANGSLERDKALCTLYEAGLEVSGELIMLNFKANRFLHNMICRLSGALIALGSGKLTKADLLRGLDERMEYRFRPAPAKGLTLQAVEYPPGALAPPAEKSE